MRVLASLLFIPLLAAGADTASADLDWLEGCWVSDDGSSREVWVVDDNDLLVGFSVSLDGAKFAFYELLSIRRNDDGEWSYHAHPSGQASTRFDAVEIADQSVLFVNPDHDYPQEIRYRREGDVLYASISLLGGENPRSFDKHACH